MKQIVFIAIVGLCIVSSTVSLCGAESPDLSDLRKSLTSKIPEFVTTDTENGATSLDGIYFFLCKGRFPGTVDGTLVAHKSALCKDVNLEAYDTKGNLLLSCPLYAEPEEEFLIFFFTLNKQLASGATLMIFPRKGVHKLQLDKVTPRTEELPALEEFIKRISKKTEPVN